MVQIALCVCREYLSSFEEKNHSLGKRCRVSWGIGEGVVDESEEAQKTVLGKSQLHSIAKPTDLTGHERAPPHRQDQRQP